MSLKIVLMPGDGIGPEVTDEAARILKDVAEHSGKSFAFSTPVSYTHLTLPTN